MKGKKMDKEFQKQLVDGINNGSFPNIKNILSKMIANKISNDLGAEINPDDIDFYVTEDGIATAKYADPDIDPDIDHDGFTNYSADKGDQPYTLSSVGYLPYPDDDDTGNYYDNGDFYEGDSLDKSVNITINIKNVDINFTN